MKTGKHEAKTSGLGDIQACRAIVFVLYAVLHLFFGSGYAQTIDTVARPELLSASVSPFTDSVTLVWTKSSTPKITGYTVFEYFSPNSSTPGAFRVFDVDTVDRCRFAYPSVKSKAVQFVIGAYRLKTGGRDMSIQTPAHRTISLSTQYDSCKAEILLRWTPYIGWGSQLSAYKVYRLRNDSSIEISGTLSASDTSLLLSNVSINTKYCFYVKALYASESRAVTSNLACCQTLNEIAPSYMLATKADYADLNLAKLEFVFDSVSTVKTIRILKSETDTSNFEIFKSFDNQSLGRLSYVDTLASRIPVHYKIAGYGICNTPLKTSNMSTIMFLKGELSGNMVNLSWNPYLILPGQSKSDNVYRKIGTGEPEKIASQSIQICSYSEDILTLAGKELSGKICYYIEAESVDETTGKTYTSISSSVCFDLTEMVFVPQGFTPNGDGVNDEYKPSFAFAPSSYQLIIYNRYGVKVFETNTVSKGWNGLSVNGNHSEQGAYPFYLSFTTIAGKKVEKKGTIALIYP